LGSNFNPQDTQILRVFLRLKFSPALTSTKLKRFEIGSTKIPTSGTNQRPVGSGAGHGMQLIHRAPALLTRDAKQKAPLLSVNRCLPNQAREERSWQWSI
jgi:hypothetical protein